MTQTLNPTSLAPAQWQAPSALTHATWQQAHAQCQTVLAQNPSAGLCMDWSACSQVDSSALAFILDIQRRSKTAVSYQHLPAALVQLAHLYEVDAVLNMPVLNE